MYSTGNNIQYPVVKQYGKENFQVCNYHQINIHPISGQGGFRIETLGAAGLHAVSTRVCKERPSAGDFIACPRQTYSEIHRNVYSLTLTTI